MYILIDFSDKEVPRKQDIINISLHFINGEVCECNYPYMVLPKGHGYDVLDKMRGEIEKVFCMSVVTNELRTPMEVKTEILQIVDKYRTESEVKKV